MLFEEDFDTRSEDISAEDFTTGISNDFLSVGGTENQIIIEDLKIDDIEISDYILFKFVSKK
jgi:hypothetical protein